MSSKEKCQTQIWPLFLILCLSVAHSFTLLLRSFGVEFDCGVFFFTDQARIQCQGLQCIGHLAMFSFSKAFGKAHQYLWKRRDESMRPEFAEESKCWKKDEGGVKVGKLYNWMNIRHHFHWHLAWCINWAKNGFSGKYNFGNHSIPLKNVHQHFFSFSVSVSPVSLVSKSFRYLVFRVSPDIWSQTLIDILSKLWNLFKTLFGQNWTGTVKSCQLVLIS